MGYNITLLEAKFCILAKNKDAALAAMKAMDPEKKGHGYWGGRKQWSWVSQSEVNEAETVEDAMSVWRYSPITDEEGNISRVVYDGEKLGDEEVLFETIAPFVEDGSYIEMEGEDSFMWRWVFEGGKVSEVTPTISWPT